MSQPPAGQPTLQSAKCGCLYSGAVQLCPTHANAHAMRPLLKHVPHNDKYNLHKMIGRVAGCPGCDAQAILATLGGQP